MAKESSPSFQWFASDYLSDAKVQVMTVEDEGCYIRLMSYCWREGSLPVDPDELAALCKGVKPSNRVLRCFDEIDGALLHKRLELERVRQQEWRDKCAKGGRRSRSKPKHPKIKSNEQSSSTNPPRVVEVNDNSSSSSSSSSKEKNPSDSLLPKRSKRAPEDFQVTDAMRLWAQREYPSADIEIETRLFRDYTYKSPRSDWEANWKNWIKNAAGHWHGSGNGSKSAQTKQVITQQELADWKREDEDKARKAAL